MTLRDYFGKEMDFKRSLGKLIYSFERETGGKIISPIIIDRLSDGEGNQVLVTPQPHIDRSGVVIDRPNSYDEQPLEVDREFEEFKKKFGDD